MRDVVFSTCPECKTNRKCEIRFLDGMMWAVICKECGKAYIPTSPDGRHMTKTEKTIIRLREIANGGKGQRLQEEIGRRICPND